MVQAQGRPEPPSHLGCISIWEQRHYIQTQKYYLAYLMFQIWKTLISLFKEIFYLFLNHPPHLKHVSGFTLPD